MRRSTAWRTPFGRWNRLALATLLIGAACAPVTRAPPAIPGLPSVEPTVRVGIVVDTTQVTIGATTPFDIVDASANRTLRRYAAGDGLQVRGGAEGQLLLVAGDTDLLLSGLLAIRPTDGGLVLIDGKAYRGSALIRSGGAGRVTAINSVDMENYLLGVVPYEIGRVGPELLEAAKAQAVAARTYAIRYLGRREALGFDVFATVQDQVYGGHEGEHDPISVAVRETAGEIMVYGGQPIEAFYHSTCAGRTAAIEEVWPEPPRPYLVSVVDVNPATGEAFDITSNRFEWTQGWSADELREIFDRTLADSIPGAREGVGELRGFEILERTQSGRIRSMRITTESGTALVGGDRIRWIFLTPEGNILNSSKFDVRVERDAQGRIVEVIAEGMGWGHGIGMCQVGAMGRARAGQDYRSILQAYYTGVEIADLY